MNAVLAAEVTPMFPAESFRVPSMWYQPILDLRNRDMVFQEALARIFVRGRMVLPSRFLDFARRHGFLPELTRNAIQSVCANLQYSVERIPPITINMPYSCLNEETYRHLFTSLGYFHVNPENIAIEVTEDELSFNEESADIFKALSSLGIRFMLDDFLEFEEQYEAIEKLPFFAVKTDQSMLRRFDEFRMRKMLERLLGLGVANVVVEGVESREDEISIIRASADYPSMRFLVQGFYYSRPRDSLFH